MKKHLLRLSTLCLLLMLTIIGKAETVTAKWDFQNGVPASITSVNIQGTDASGMVASDVDGIQLKVLAAVAGTNIKLAYNSNGYAQFNNNTTIQVPVISDKDVVTVVSYPGQYKYTVGGTAATDNETNHTATKAEAQQGYVEITATGTAYLYSIQVVQDKDAASQIVADVTATWDYSNADVMAATIALSGSSTEGTVKAVENNGVLMTVLANGAAFRNNGNNIQIRKGAEFRIPVKSTEDIVTIKGYPGYSYYTVGNNTDEIKNTNDNPLTTYKAKNADVAQGYVSIKSTNDNNYFYSLSVVQKAPKQMITLTDEAVKATFAFNAGTEGQKADFGEGADYFLNSKVTYGENLTLNGKDNKGNNQTWFGPAVKQTKADETNAIRFLITPRPGFVFTPTKVSLKSTRYGTNGGSLDIAWQNPDKSTVALATAQQPNRDNATPNVSEFAYDVTGATPAEGTSALLVNLYNLDKGKNVGFADIVIEGTLSGTEKEVPILESFKINGTTYTVEDVFGEDYEATLKLSKSEAMIGTANPLTDVTAASGELGTVTYEGTETACKVVIPVSAGETTLEYVLSIIQKPDYTLSYIDVDGTTVLKTQTVEEDGTIGTFAYDIATVKATKEGYKARGWFKQNYAGAKYATTDVVTSNLKLYAVQTEIEVPSDSRKYVYNLADANFFDEDHEGFNSVGNGRYYNNHGWIFNNGDQIELLVGKKASINLTLCQYSNANATIEASNGATVNGKVDSDGGMESFEYEGEEGTLTLTINSPGAVYIHGITVLNTTTTNYTKNGQYIIVKKGDASSLIDALDAANGSSGSDRVFIYLPDGTYDLGQTALTTIGRNNVSLIGQSMEGTIIKNAPDINNEGIGTTATILNASTGLYMQDLTLQNALDYYGAIAAGMGGGRAVCLQDKGKQTIAKNVRMLSYQDTYYSNSNSQFYWEDSEIHGTVDYLCGGGDVYYNGCTFVNESRAATGKSGSDVIAAPYTDASSKFGYVFNNCTIENKAASFSLGRSWGGTARLTYLNTTINQPGEIVATRFTLAGMNVASENFHEFQSVDKDGNVVSPASLVETFTHSSGNYTYDIIFSAQQAAEYAYSKVFTSWNPAAQTVQADQPAGVELRGRTLRWDSNSDVAAWVIIKDGKVIDITTSNSYETDDAAAAYAVCATSIMGGLSEPAKATAYATVNFSDTGYATFYDANNSYELPHGVTAYVVSAATTESLTYTEIKDVIPANTAVMLEKANHRSGEYQLVSTQEEVTYEGENLLKGSNYATTTTADGDNYLFYKLTYGNSASEQANTFGWFWGAAGGAAFQIEAHRAWLAIPQQKAATRGYAIGKGDGTTGISITLTDGEDNGAYYNMQGQRIANPGKGLYIHQGKKVIIK